MTTEKLEQQLRAAGAELAAADEARRRALQQIKKAMQDGDGLMPVAQMAALAGVSRVTAYRLLERK